MEPITLEALRTVGGQAAAILVAIQGIKLAIPWLRKPGEAQDNAIQILAVVLGLGLSLKYGAASGVIPALYNGLVAALASMKGFDFASRGALAVVRTFAGR